MTFRETDYPDILEILINEVNQNRNPLILRELVREIWNMHKAVPTYPGIVGMCSGNLVKKVSREEIRPGDWVCLSNTQGAIYGQVESVEGGRITLSQALKIENLGSTEVSHEEIGSVERVQKDVLKKTWPSLVFKEQ